MRTVKRRSQPAKKADVCPASKCAVVRSTSTPLLRTVTRPIGAERAPNRHEEAVAPALAEIRRARRAEPTRGG